MKRLLITVCSILVGCNQVFGRRCPYGWFDRPNSNRCYLFSQNSATNTWEDSRLKCIAAGGDLASIQSKDEWHYITMTMQKLYNSLHHAYQHWWIGLNRKDDGVTWKWADGSVADMSLLTWRKDAKASKSKNCVQMNMFLMDYGSCTGDRFQSICSRQKDLPIQCDADNGWSHYNQKCYKYFNTARTWNDASKACKDIGAQLPNIPDLTTQTVVGSFAREHKTDLWIGLRPKGKPNAITWTWEDGTRNNGLTYWHLPDQPPSNLNSVISTTCVELNSHAPLPATWVATSCRNKRKYYCEKPEGTCASGWLEYGKMCYLFNPHYQLSWPKALAYCHGLGGNLVTITNSNTQKFLNPYLRPQSQVGVKELWIGITDNNKDSGPWKFTTGSSLSSKSYQNWNSHPPPNHKGRQDCAYMFTSDPNGKWRISNSCTQVRSFICQIQTNVQVKQITQPPNHYICPSKWVNNGAYCYYFNENDAIYDSARGWCQRQNADLVRIPDKATQSFLESKVKHGGDYWIGLTDRAKEGSYVWLDDTTNATFTYWKKGQPNNVDSRENCVRFFASGSPDKFGHWGDEQCSNSKFNFICQMKAQNSGLTPPTTTPKPWSSKCGPFWSSDPFNPNCYQFHDEKLSWFDARGACKAHGGDLATIATSEESSYITGRLRQMKSADFWIGANDRGTEGGWKWADGRPFGFINWNAGEPNNYQNREDCGAMFYQTGRWHDSNCNERKGYVCKKRAYFVCDSGWKEFKHNCYNLNHAKMSWSDSRNWCKHHASDLVRITDIDVLGFIRANIDQTGDWWIGLNDKKTEGRWVWLDDKSPGGIVQWKVNEPNNQGNEDCAALATSLGDTYFGKYNDWPCSRKSHFICRKSGRMVDHTSLPQTTTPKSVPAGSTYGCPLNWNGFRGSCYYFAWGSGSYDNSAAQCGYQGAKLASIIDDAENNFAFSVIPKSISQAGKAAWIGLNDRAIEMKFVWMDGQPISFTKWANGEPNNWQGHDEDCVAMYTKSPYWKDERCSRSLQGSICKKPKSVIPNSQLEIGKGCSGSQIGFHATCYEFNWSPTRTWSDAEKNCVSKKGHLATVPDRHVQAYLGAEMLYKPSAFWVGLSDVQNPGHYSWSSGQSFVFSAWYETHTGNERGTCAAIRAGHPAGLWENHNCTDHRSFICEYPRTGYTTPTTPPTTTPSSIPCPTSWTDFAGVCYKYFGGVTNLQAWTASRQICNGYGGDLVSVYNASLESFFVNTLAVNTSIWIGLNDRDAEDGYQWSDGSAFGYSNWAPGEPNDYNNREDCTEFNSLSHAWNDYYCYDAKNYVCQLPKGVQITTTPQPPTGVTSTQCRGNGTWLYYSKSCYQVSPSNTTDAEKTWYDARRYCMAEGGDLASIHGPDDNGFITSLVAKRYAGRGFWIGLNNLDMSGYQWTDGSPVQYLAWEAHEPNDGAGEKRCVKLFNHRGSWMDDNCNFVLPFVCQKPPLNTAPRTPPPTAIVPGGCPAGFSTISRSNRCYMVAGASSNQRLNWTNANSACHRAASGANLAVIGSQLENKFVVTLMRGLKVQAWTGLMDQRINGHYMWVDSSEVAFTNWAPGQPNEDISNDKIQHRRDCVMMWHNPTGRNQAGGWDDYFCDHKMAYICSVPKITMGYVTPTPRTAGCPTGYLRYAAGCYKGVTQPDTWSNAQMNCAMTNGNLVSIGDVFEASFVDLMVSNQGPSWIGLSDLESTGHFSWTDKYPVRYTRWAWNEPTTQIGNGCVLEKGNFMWNDTDCNLRYKYICENHVGNGPITTQAIIGHCPDSTWTKGTDYCYKAIGSIIRSWPEARYACQREGGDLASIESQAEMTYLFNMLNGNTTDIWIGMSKMEQAGFVWSDRSPVGFLNWAQNEPSDPKNLYHQDCVMLMATGGWKWNDLDCFIKAGYLCKTIQSTSTYQTTPNPQYNTQKPVNPQQPQTNRPTLGPTRGPHTFGPQGLNTPYNPIRPLTTYNPFHPNYGRNTAAPLVSKSGANSGGALSGGAIAGIVIGVLIVLALLGAGYVGYRMRGKIKVPGLASSGFSNALYTKDDEDVSVS